MNTSQASASTPDTAAADAYLREALHALPVCFDHCECGDHWHAVWAGLKATGMQRTLHSQTDFLTALLKPYTVPGGLVMIAGAADTGSLEVLHTAIDDAGQRYCVIDRCEAPLQLVRQRAAELAMSLHARHGTLETVRAEQPWDMVFIHYTLSFMDRAARLQFIHHLRQDLAPRGVVVCAVRQTQPDAHSTPAEQLRRWTQTSAARLASTFAGHGELLARLQQWLPAYAQVRQQRQSRMPPLEQLLDEFLGAGFKLLESHLDPGQTPTGTTQAKGQDGATAWIHVLALDRD